MRFKNGPDLKGAVSFLDLSRRNALAQFEIDQLVPMSDLLEITEPCLHGGGVGPFFNGEK